jgi:hypothetical protein
MYIIAFFGAAVTASLTLPLFVAGISADHANHAFTLNDFTFLTDWFY